MHLPDVRPTPAITPPYYVSVFVSARTPGDLGYAVMVDHLVRTAELMPGFLGMDAVRDDDGFGITVSYWQTKESILAWRDHSEHRVAQRLGPEKWYEDFTVHVARVECSFDMRRPHADTEPPCGPHSDQSADVS